jgi:hypothetical protein
MGPRKGQRQNELLWQIRHAGACLWVSTGRWLELMIHQVDECCWLKDAWPVSAHGVGGRTAFSTDCSQNLDSYSIEYTFADGTKAMVNGRFIANCYNEFATFVHGTKCAGQFSGNIHAATVATVQGPTRDRGDDNIVWQPEKETANPWQAEWNVLLDAIRNDRPHNETQRAAYANLAGLMGRAAVHSGKIITWEEALASTSNSAPTSTVADRRQPRPRPGRRQGRYPAPVPGTRRARRS